MGKQAEISSKLQISAQTVTNKSLTVPGRSQNNFKVRVIRGTSLSARENVISPRKIAELKADH